jgi:hypothetical protein
MHKKHIFVNGTRLFLDPKKLAAEGKVVGVDGQNEQCGGCGQDICGNSFVDCRTWVVCKGCGERYILRGQS